MPNIDVSIVIVNFNTKDYTVQCIDSILKDPPVVKFEFILVDNASSDSSAEFLEARYPESTVIRSDKNIGIAGGNNLGIKAASGRFILLLNNDTIVLPHSIDRSVEFLTAHPEAGGVGGNLINADGSFQSGNYNFPTLGRLFLISTKIGQLMHYYYPSNARSEDIQEVDWMSTAFMTFRREALFSVGLVDEQYFIYSDESDLQLRMKKAGWKIYYLPDLQTIHFGGRSLNPWRRRRLVYRGYLLFFNNHRGAFQTMVIRLMFTIICLLKIPFWMINYLMPERRKLADEEMKSNWSIIRMCLKPGIEAV
jgi:hypothetical protein